MIEIEKECSHDECGDIRWIATLVMIGALKFPEWTNEMMLTSPVDKYPAHFSFHLVETK